MTQASKSINARIDSLDLQSADLHYLVGWLISSAPVQLMDALDAVEEQRERRAQTRGRGIPRDTGTMGAGNVAGDDRESLVFADESE